MRTFKAISKINLFEAIANNMAVEGWAAEWIKFWEDGYICESCLRKLWNLAPWKIQGTWEEWQNKTSATDNMELV